MKEHPSLGFIHYWFPPKGATNNEDFAIYLHSVTCRAYFSEEDRRKQSKIALTFLDPF